MPIIALSKTKIKKKNVIKEKLKSAKFKNKIYVRIFQQFIQIMKKC